MTKSNRGKKNRKHLSGHMGRGKPKAKIGERRRAHGRVAGENIPSEGIIQPAAKGVRINRWLSERGVASRRKCDDLIRECSVEVNGNILTEPGYLVQEGDVVCVDGKPVKDVRRLYYLFHKPKSVLCTDDPRESRMRVCDLVEPLVAGRVVTVGRLDEDSEGLLLLTNDGDFANMMTHPRYGIPKTYSVLLNGALTMEELEELRKGAWIDSGKVVPESVRIARRGKSQTTVEVCLCEGRNREVRRLFARVGHGVKRLQRIRIGNLNLRGVRRGGVRPLTREERDELVRMARKGPNDKAQD
ncbi:MAG: pseudouridine synthase [Planctomycetota bacterium]|jgi:23S rRNA pseudouridine2605 synthase|nr:pseudouridine synthase [Planctomycetota bacterium]MDP6941204.1 pseudouridine synthase [Planctomycetota bacterium]